MHKFLAGQTRLLACEQRPSHTQHALDELKSEENRVGKKDLAAFS
jgi:hypothetical protein